MDDSAMTHEHWWREPVFPNTKCFCGLKWSERMTAKEIKIKELATALSSAIGQLAIADDLYKEVFPNHLPFYKVDLNEIRTYAVQARNAIKQACYDFDKSEEAVR